MRIPMGTATATMIDSEGNERLRRKPSDYVSMGKLNIGGETSGTLLSAYSVAYQMTHWHSTVRTKIQNSLVDLLHR